MMRPWSPLWPPLGAAVVIFLCGPWSGDGGAGRAAAADDLGYEDRVRAVEVAVPVNVVDRDGRPVRDLDAVAFELLDEGVEQEIVDFRIVDLDRRGADAADSGGRSPVLESVARRHFLLLFDFSFSSPAALLRARQAAREFALNALAPADLAAVVTYSLDVGPRLVMTFSPDRAQLARVLDTLGAPSLLRNSRSADPLRFIVESPGGGVAGGYQLAGSASITSATDPLLTPFRVVGKQIDKGEKAFERSRVRSWSRALGEMADTLRQVEGRKQVVYFTEGFDGRLLFGRQPSNEDDEARLDRLDLSLGQHWMVDSDDIYGSGQLLGEVNDMLERFRRCDCVIQAVDISGARTDSGQGGRNRSVRQDAMFYLARATGGALFEDSNALAEQLRQVLERSNVTYVLTFRPTDLHDGDGYHRLRVHVDRDRVRGGEVSHRSGYFPPRPFADLHPLEKSLLASDAIASAAPRREIGIDLLATPFRASPTSAYVPVIVEISGEELLRDHAGERLLTEIYAYVTDAQGEMRDFFSQSVSIDLATGRAALAEGGLKYYGHLELASGDHLVRVLVRNAETGRTGVQSTPVHVPLYAAAEASLLPPLFMNGAAGWLLVREKAESYEPTIVYPFTVKGEPYIPAVRPTLNRDQEALFCLVGYNLGRGEIELVGSVEGDEGRVAAGSRLMLVERTVTGMNGVDKLLMSFKPAGLDGGDYTLQVAVTDPESGARRMSAIAFRVAGRAATANRQLRRP